jgi:hypothetical protein
LLCRADLYFSFLNNKILFINHEYATSQPDYWTTDVVYIPLCSIGSCSVRGNVISYIEMCQKEGMSLQKGMNFRLKGHHSVILMSVRPNSPYRDEVQEDGAVLIYEGHDEPRHKGISDPKALDQPERQSRGTLTRTENFIRQHNGSRPVKKALTLFRFTKRSKRVFGPTTDSFTW